MRIMERARRDSAWIPWAFVGGFLTMFAANGALVYASFTSWTGLQTESPYERGLQFNETIADGRRQLELGWRGDIRTRLDPAGGTRVEVALKDAAGVPITGATVRARMVRPIGAGHDFEVDIPERGDGTYAAVVAPPLPGQWEARVFVERGRDRFRLDDRFVVAR